MTQSFLQPKGMLKPQIGIEDLTKQYAQIFSKPQAQEQTESTNPMRQTLNDYFTKIMANQITMPKYTTLSDVLGANKGDKLGVFADFLKNPQTMRTIGGLLPKYGYNPQTGKMGNVMEEPARKEEALMQAEQEKALQQMKEQNDIATSLNSAFNQMDIADMNDKRMRELAEQEQKWRTEEAEKDRAFRRAENAANRANSLAISRLVHGGGGNTKLTAAQQTAMSNISQMDTILNLIKQTPNATGFWQGINPALNKMESKNPKTAANITTRAAIDKLRTEIRHTLTGAQFSPKEAREYEKFLPTNMDNPTEINQKINGLKIMFMSDPRLLGNVGLSNTQSSHNDPMGLGL